MAVMARETWTDERLDHLSERMDERFDRVDERFDRVDERFNRVDERFKHVEGRLDRVETSLKDLHDDNRAMQKTITQAVTSICTAMVGGFAAIFAALVGMIAL